MYTLGTSPGNPMNGGLACMDDESNLYFCNVQTSELIKMDDNLENKVVIADFAVFELNYMEDTLYFRNGLDNCLWTSDLECDSYLEALTTFPVEDVLVINDSVYFVNIDDHRRIYKLNRFSRTLKCLSKDMADYLYFDGGYIYYCNMSHGESLYKIDLEGKNRELVVNGKVGFPNILSNKLYYTDWSNKDKFTELDLVTGEKVILCEGKCGDINADHMNVFFSNYDLGSRLCAFNLQDRSIRIISTKTNEYTTLAGTHIFTYNRELDKVQIFSGDLNW